MHKDQRRDAKRALQDRKSDAGIYAFRNAAQGVWVGQAKSLASAENRLWFSLRTNGNLPADLRLAWQAAPESGFVFEVLERLDPELVAMARDDLLKARALYWRRELAAAAL